MPMRAARICGCGHRIATGSLCPCDERRNRERKARHDAKRPSASKRGYDTKWQRESKAYLATHRTCVRCGSPSTLVDHVIPHKGDQRLFWSRSNWQAMCTPCHSRAKQTDERRQAPGGGSRLPEGTNDRRGDIRAGFFRNEDFPK